MSAYQSDIMVKDDTLIVVASQDCTAIAEACKVQQIEGVTGTSDMKLAGRIPDIFVEKYLNDNHITFREFMNNPEHAKRILNDPAMAHFRVWKGKL
jgi:hypothetical protein